MEHDPAYLQVRMTKVQDEAECQVGCTQVVETLLAVSSFDACSGFDLYDQAILYQQVGNVVSNDDSLVGHLKGKLLKHFDPSLA